MREAIVERASPDVAASCARVRGVPSRSSSKTSLVRTAGSIARCLSYVYLLTSAELSTEVAHVCQCAGVTTTTPSSTAPVLRVRGVTKSFAGHVVLRDADLDLLPGQVHGLVGENGAGK